MKRFDQFKKFVWMLDVLIAGFGLTIGCVKEDDFDFSKVAESNWTPDVAVPIVSSSLTMSDFLLQIDSNLVSVDSNHFITLVYTGNVYSLYGYEFLPVLDQSGGQSLTLAAPEAAALNLAGPVSRTINSIFPISMPNGEQLDSLNLRTGILDISIFSAIPRSGTLTISIPSATLSGVPFNVIVPFSTTGGMPINVLSTTNMSGYKFDLISTGTSNQMQADYTISFNASGGSPVTIGQNFDITCNFRQLQIADAFGDFGQRSINISADSVAISMLHNAAGGTFYLDDPSLTFNIYNSFGMPLDAHLNSLIALPSSGPGIPVMGSIPDPLPINSPTVLGQTASSTFTIDKTNSNIQSVMNESTKFIEYDVNATSNLPTPTYNFVQDSSRFRVDMQVKLPLNGYVSGFTIMDTIDFNIDSVEELESVSFRINITNGFPLDVFTQLYFTDSLYTIIDSLITNPLDLMVESGVTNTAGLVIQPTHKMKDEPFDHTRLQRIYNAKKILIKGIIDSRNAPNQNVLIYSNYTLAVKIGVRAQLVVPLH